MPRDDGSTRALRSRLTHRAARRYILRRASGISPKAIRPPNRIKCVRAGGGRYSLYRFLRLHWASPRFTKRIAGTQREGRSNRAQHSRTGAILRPQTTNIPSDLNIA